MANYTSTFDLKRDVLFRASEAISGTSGWDGKVLEYLNRCYRELATGASSFLPEYVEDWWWMREEGSILLEPVYKTGNVTLTNGSATIVFSPVVAFSPKDWRIRFLNIPDIFIITSSGTGLGAHTIDQPFTGVNGVYTFQMMKTEYDLVSGMQALIGPMSAFRDPENRIYGLSPERMDELFPLIRLLPGIPQAFAIQNQGDTTSVRFSHGGNIDGTTKMKVDYRYRPRLTDLIDSAADIPRVPFEYRHVLADMALVFVLLDKNDDRANAAALGARTVVASMLKENRRRNVKVDYLAGHVSPRPLRLNNRGGPLRTQSGLIIG